VKPRAEKTAAIVRPGNFGDALWASTVAHALKREGYHVTAYVESGGEEVLRHDPNIDEFLIIDKSVVPTSMYGTMWLAEEKRYDRWINLVESVEVRLLLFPSQVPFGWPAAGASRALRQELPRGGPQDRGPALRAAAALPSDHGGARLGARAAAPDAGPDRRDGAHRLDLAQVLALGRRARRAPGAGAGARRDRRRHPRRDALRRVAVDPRP
jgi:hypothetical protein